MNEYLRDYNTASQIFRTGVYRGSPKFKFLFHTYFDINPEAYDQGLNTGRNFGLEVRDAKLPSYSFKTAVLNQYNRKRIVQTKINYEEVTITFFDDNNNVINKLWEAYYKYYYADGNKPKVVFGSIPPGGVPNTQVGSGGVTTTNNSSTYNSRNIYDDSITGNTDWGYIGETNKPGAASGKKVPFFKNITVFGFSPGNNFTAYTLVNPLITSFSHDTFNYDEGNGVMKNTMRLDYETVVYNYGNMGAADPSSIIKGFALPESYDTRISPNLVANINPFRLFRG